MVFQSLREFFVDLSLCFFEFSERGLHVRRIGAARGGGTAFAVRVVHAEDVQDFVGDFKMASERSHFHWLDFML